MCISWTNKEFDIINAWYNHEEQANIYKLQFNVKEERLPYMKILQNQYQSTLSNDSTPTVKHSACCKLNTPVHSFSYASCDFAIPQKA
jgi:hypothetical protein